MILRLKKTIRNHEQHGDKANFKQRYVQFKCWNQRSLDELHRLVAIAERICGAGGGFVEQAELLVIGRGAAASHSSALRADCRAGGSSDFGRWVLQNLWPAVDRYQLNASSQTLSCFFYMFPQTPGAMVLVRQGYGAASVMAARSGAKAAVAAVDVRSYLSLIPSRAQKRIIVSMLSEIAQSKTFLSGSFGLSVARQNMAKEKVTVALIAAAKFEIVGLQVPSDMTTAEASTDLKRRREVEVTSALSDNHAGARESLVDACVGIGANLGAVIEAEAAQLGKHDYGGGAGSRRDSSDILRKCSWVQLASAVEASLRAKETEKLGAGNVWNKSTNKPISVSERCLRTYCVARMKSSIEGWSHNTVANVGCRKLQAAPGGKGLVDARSSNARVRNLEQAFLKRTKEIRDAAVHYADDHSKWEADKKRGYVTKSTILHMDKRQVSN